MKQIKTIKNRLDNNKDFDKEVNDALAAGWTLTKREVIIPLTHATHTVFYTMLYAELEMETATEAEYVERSCETCKHYNESRRTRPCDCCEDVNDIPSLWEAK